jgi:hypothetical protein
VNGWWKRSWKLTVPGQSDLSTFDIPIPSSEMDVAVVVCLFSMGNSDFLLQVLTSTETMDGDVQTYLAVIAASLKKQFGVGVAVDELRDHPWFSMVKI